MFTKITINLFSYVVIMVLISLIFGISFSPVSIALGVVMCIVMTLIIGSSNQKVKPEIDDSTD